MVISERAVVFPLPQWLRERAVMFYTHNCLIFIRTFYKPKTKLLLEQREGFCETENVSRGTRWRRSACLIPIESDLHYGCTVLVTASSSDLNLSVRAAVCHRTQFSASLSLLFVSTQNDSICDSPEIHLTENRTVFLGNRFINPVTAPCYVFCTKY